MYTVEMIFYIMMTMLSQNNAHPSYLASEAVQTRLYKLAEAIEEHSDYQVTAPRLIALAYKESRFGYRERDLVNEGSGACGAYHQIPKNANGGETDCGQLMDPRHATMQAVAYLKYIDRRWGRSESITRRSCHYFSGNKCDDLESDIYALKYKDAYDKARSEFDAFYMESDEEISDNFIREQTDEIISSARDWLERHPEKALKLSHSN